MNYSKRTLSAVITLSLLGTFACNAEKKSGETRKEQPAASAENKAQAKDPSTLLTGDKPAVPAVFKGLEPGMKLDAAKAKLPGLPDKSTFEDAEYGSMSFYVYVPKDETAVKTLRFNLPKDTGLAMVKAKWGEPTLGEDLGKPVHYWYAADKGLRVSLDEGYGDNLDLEFSSYSPMAKLLGEGRDIAFLSKAPVIGASVEQLKAAYGEWLHVESASEAKANKAAIDKLTEGASARITTGKPSAYLDLPPTEYGSQFMRVNLSFDDKNLVESYRFSFSYRQVKAKKDEIFSMLEKKWGAPKKTEKYGEPVFVFSAKPYITVEPDTISDAWDIKVQAKAN